MPVKSTAGRAVGTTIKGARLTARGGTRAGRWIGRNVGFFRNRSGAGETGMIRLLDLHAASCAGDTLVTLGLAGTIFFNVPVGEARGRVALYLLITMAPFALLAPVVGPLLDRFRHGRRYALALTMLGRAFLAWLISDYLGSVALYPAAFGVLALSRAYGVARSAAVPRLLPPGLGLSEAGARASIYGTLAGAIIAPVGLVAFWLGHAWPLRVAAVVFVIGMVIALRLPPKADSEPPETVPRISLLLNRNGAKVLSGRLVLAVLSGSAALRALYGFLTLFLAFSIRSGDLTTTLFGMHLSQTKALAYAIGALGVGTFVATAIGSRTKIHRPTLLQAGGMIAVTIAALAATIEYNLGFVIVLCLTTAIVSGLAKLAVDASIQEKIPEQVRGSAFAHSETLLMLAFVVGGGVGLFPFPGRVGIGIAAGGLVLAATRAIMLATRLRNDRLRGVADGSLPTGTVPTGTVPTVELVRPAEAATEYRASTDSERQRLPAAGAPTASPNSPTGPNSPASPNQAAGGQVATAHTPASAGTTAVHPAAGGTTAINPPAGAATAINPPAAGLAATRIESGPAARAAAPVAPGKPKTPRWRRLFASSTDAPVPPVTPSATRVLPRGEADQPGYHLYRPTSTDASQDSST
jgi:MFS family permease